MKKIKDYLFKETCTDLDYEYAAKFYKDRENEALLGGCSFVRAGTFLGSNYDWKYDNSAEFIINTPATATAYATVGIAGGFPDLTGEFVESGEWSDLYKVLPFQLLDGMNEYGVFAKVLVVPSEGEENVTTAYLHEERELSADMVVRFVLDTFKSAVAAAQYLRNHCKIYFPANLHEMGYEVHFVIADANITIMAEAVDNTLEIFSIDAKPYATNFLLYGTTPNEDGSFYTPLDAPEHTASENGITPHGSGLERYNAIVEGITGVDTAAELTELVEELKFTKAYDPDNAWYTEFVVDDLTVDSEADDFADAMEAAAEAFEERVRDAGLTWQTVHTAIYDIHSKLVTIYTQEDYTASNVASVFNIEPEEDELERVIEVSELPTVGRNYGLYLLNDGENVSMWRYKDGSWIKFDTGAGEMTLIDAYVGSGVIE